MGEKKEEALDNGGDLGDLDEAFDEALEVLSDANAKVTEVLETMDDPEAISTGTEVDEDGNIHESEEASEAVDEAETEQAEPEPSES